MSVMKLLTVHFQLPVSQEECKKKGGKFIVKKQICDFVYILEDVCIRLTFRDGKMKLGDDFGAKNFDRGGCFADNGVPQEFGLFSTGRYRPYHVEGNNLRQDVFSWDSATFTLRFAEDADIYDQKIIFLQSQSKKDADSDEL